MSLFHFIQFTLLSLACVTQVHAFSFTLGKAVQCGDLSVSWTGGSPPFSLLLLPAFGTPRNISIPSSAFNNGQGSYSTQVVFNEAEHFVVIMSDTTGFNTGGTSGLITVGAPQGANCNTTDPGTNFTFQTPGSLQQCRPFPLVEYGGAQLPVTVYGVVPSGTSFVSQTSFNSFQWTANAAAGTSIIIFLIDSAGRQGGATDLLTVGRSDSADCLDNSSHLSTTASPSQTGGVSVPSAAESGSSKPSVPAITGAVVGVLVLLAAAVAVGIFFYRRRRGQYNPGSGGIISPFRSRRNRHSQRIRSDFDLMGDKSDPFTGSNDGHTGARQNDTRSNLPPGHEPSPFLLSPLPPPSASYHGQSNGNGESQSLHSSYHDAHSSIHESTNGRGDPTEPPPNPFHPTHTSQSSSSMTAAQRKRAMAGVPAYTPSRFIVHTDLEDAEPDDDGGVVELPPQYSEKRAPVNPQVFDSASSSQTTPALNLHSQDPNAEVGRHLKS